MFSLLRESRFSTWVSQISIRHFESGYANQVSFATSEPLGLIYAGVRLTDPRIVLDLVHTMLKMQGQA